MAGHYGLGHIKEIGLLEGVHIHMGLVPLGQGPTPWRDLLTWMAPHMPDDSWLVLEHVASVEEGRASIAYLRQVAEDASLTLG